MLNDDGIKILKQTTWESLINRKNNEPKHSLFSGFFKTNNNDGKFDGNFSFIKKLSSSILKLYTLVLMSIYFRFQFWKYLYYHHQHHHLQQQQQPKLKTKVVFSFFCCFWLVVACISFSIFKIHFHFHFRSIHSFIHLGMYWYFRIFFWRFSIFISFHLFHLYLLFLCVYVCMYVCKKSLCYSA